MKTPPSFLNRALCCGLLILPLLGVGSVHGAAFTWDNTGTDYNTAVNWTPDTVPSGNNVARFDLAAVTQPNLSLSVSIAGILFDAAVASGYNVTSSAGQSFTLTGTDTSGSSGTSNSNAAALRSEATSGTNTITAPLILGAASGSQIFFREAGGTLIVNGVVSSTNAINLSLRGAGTIELNAANLHTGGTSTDVAANQTLVIGNNSALGTGTFAVNIATNVQAGGGARTIANATTLNGTATIGGSNALTFNGPVTAAGALSRTLTVNNSALTTIQGGVFLSDVAGTGRTLLINGTGNVVINGQISNFNGAGTAGTLSHGGSGTLTLTNTNIYTGGTLLSGGTTIVTQSGGLGSGNVSLTAANVTLTLQGATNNYISDTAAFSIGFVDDIVNLNYTGTDTINTLTIAGVQEAPGIYGAIGSGAQFERPELFGTGTLMVLTQIPEPTTYMLFGLGVLVCAQQFRRKKS